MEQVTGWLTRVWGTIVHHFHHMTLGMALWLGFLLLTLVLMILMSTRWGSVKPIWKCVILSVFAHILLGGYAYGTRLIFTGPQQVPSDTISLRLVDNDTPASDAEDTMTSRSQPWDELDLAPRIAPPQEAVARLTPQVQQTTQRRQPEIAPQQTQPQLPDEIQGQVSPVATPPLTAEHSPTAQAHEIRKSQAAAKKIELQRQKREEASTFAVGPESLTAQAARIDPVQDKLSSPDTSRTAPQPLESDAAQRQQRLKELGQLNGTSQAELADALEAERKTTNLSGEDLQWGQPLKTIVPARLASAPLRLADGKPMPELYSGRSPEQRKEAASKFGGSPESEQAVEVALRWLVSAQEPDGSWSSARFGGGQERLVMGHDRKGAGSNADTGITGLSLLALLAAGHSHLEGEHRETVQRGLEYLLRSQAPDGDIAGDARLFARMYCHAMATLAITETLAMTGDQRLQAAVEAAVAYSLKAQHPSRGGWRYRPGDAGDMSQFGWQVLVMKSAELAGIKVPSGSKQLMKQFLEQCTAGQQAGLASYRPGMAPSTTMTAEALVCRHFLDEQVSPATASEASQFLLRDMPGSGPENMYYWYYGTLAMYYTGGSAWDNWNHQLTRTLINSQVQEGEFSGSWNPTGVWAGYGGRVYSTAMATLCLEVYYRYQTR